MRALPDALPPLIAAGAQTLKVLHQFVIPERP
jgi:hypothetical protein